MAEFCKKHSREMGFPFGGYPVFCETCGTHYQKPKSLLTTLSNWFSSIINIRSRRYWRRDK